MQRHLTFGTGQCEPTHREVLLQGSNGSEEVIAISDVDMSQLISSDCDFNENNQCIYSETRLTRPWITQKLA